MRQQLAAVRKRERGTEVPEPEPLPEVPTWMTWQDGVIKEVRVRV